MRGGLHTAGKVVLLSLLAGGFLFGSPAGAASPKLHIDTTDALEVRLIVDPGVHSRFGLAFPVTYIVGVPPGDAGLTAYMRHDTAAAWTPLPTKTSSDFFNDIQVARFDTALGIAYVSASFGPESDILSIRIADSTGNPVALAYRGIARYYDNRDAAVLLSIDDWKAMTDSLFRHATSVLRSYDLTITAAIITGDCDDATWSHIQQELDAGAFEAASHTRSHLRWPYSQTEIYPQVLGSRQDILTHLDLPTLYRKGSTEYVYSFLVPYGETGPELEAAVTQSGYLISRLVGTSDGEFTAWDPQAYRYQADGTTMELGPPWGSTDLDELNAAFDSATARGHIYHLLMHPYSLGETDEWSNPYLTDHLAHISRRQNLWYATMGQLYGYHLLADSAIDESSPPSLGLAVVSGPSHASIRVGETATFEVLAIGSPPLTFQWYRDFAPIAGATAPVYTIPPAVQSDDGASFWCVVSSGTSSITSGTAVLSVSDSIPSEGENILVNSGFEDGTDSWEFYSSSSGVFNQGGPGFESAHAGVVTIAEPASNLQLYQTGFPLEAGERYRLSFHAYSTGERNLSVIIQQHSSPYTILGLSQTEFDLSSTWQEYSVELIASGFAETTSDTRVRFWMAPYAQAGDQYYFDNISIRKVYSSDHPIITDHPVSQSAIAGETVEFTVQATGDPPLFYQWQRNQIDIASATNPVLELPAVTLADSGAVFRCVVSNAHGSATSALAMLHVRTMDPLPGDAIRVVILGSSTAEGEAARPLSNAWANRYREFLRSINPESELINLAIGGFTTFNVMPDGYVPPSPWNTPAYLPVSRNNITYALSLRPTFIILNLPTNDCASYIPVAVQMQNYGRIVSEAQALGVPVWITTPQPRNIDPAGRSLLFELLTATETEYPGRVIDFWTDLADPQGFILPEYNYDNTHLNNAGHAILFDRLINTVRWDPPVIGPRIVVDPQAQTVLEGDTVLFVVSVQGTPPFTFRWQKDGMDLAGFADSVCRISSVTLADSGAAFRVIVSNSAGSDTSSTALLHVLPIVRATVTRSPADTTLWAGGTARLAVSATGTQPLAYRWQRSGVDIEGATDSVYVLSAITPGDSGATFRAIVSNRGGADTSLAAILHVLHVVPPAVTVDPLDTTLFAGQTARFTVSAQGTTPLAYRWQKNGIDISGEQDSVYTLSSVLLADSGAAFRAIVSNSAGVDTSATATLHVLPALPPTITRSPSDTTLLIGQTARLSVPANGTPPLNYRWQKNGTDIEGATDSVYLHASVAYADSGATFRAIVSNIAGADTSVTATLHVLPALPPTITRSPSDTTLLIGQTARLSVSANGTPPLNYRWQKNGTDIEGATDSVYLFASVAYADSGATFRAIVSNSAGSDTSSTALLHVLPIVRATVTRSPADTTLWAGGTARFVVSATGTQPLAYKWQRSGVDIEGAADSVYVLSAVTPGDSGAAYRAIVSNSAGADTSSVAVLRVLPIVPAAITLDPVDTVLVVGGSARFTVSATGTAPIAFRWQRNGVDIDGATDSVYTIPVVTAADSGALFRVIVSNSAGSDTSQTALLHVTPEPMGATLLRVRVYLQGPLTGDTMSTALNRAGLIPLHQPYSAYPWNYAGTESLAVMGAGVVDWVLVELRTGEAESTTVASRAGLLKSDGMVVDLDEVSPLAFLDAEPGFYHVAVHHRNHLSVMSANPVRLSNADSTYDFTASGDRAYGREAMIGTGAGGTYPFALFGGDVNGDGQVTSSDFNLFLPKFVAGILGYETSDWNLDGQITSSDFNLYLANFTSGRATRLP